MGRDTGDERKVFRAVAKTHLATHLAIFTHTNFGKGALEQLELLESMGVAGFADRLLFSSDFSAGGSQLKRNGGPGYAKTLTVFAPKLRAAGVDEKTLHGILVDNPRRLLAFVPRSPGNQRAAP